MANLADKSGDAYSNIVNGTGTSSATFTTPGGVPLDVESVVATIDNAAGGATTATLTVRDSSGQVIAVKRQGDTIPAAGSGTATWALRLADDGGGAAGIQFDVANIGNLLDVETANTEFDVTKSYIVSGSGAGTQVSLRASGFTGFRALESSGVELSLGVGETVVIVGHLGTTLFEVAEDGTVTVTNVANGDVFRVDPNGDLHGKTGKALVFDL